MVLRIERYAKGADVALIEGAGGLLAPITWEWNVTDLAQALGAKALVVASDRLGTINHTLLTLSVLELSGIPVPGVMLTAPERADRSTGTNAATIARLSGINRVMTTPRTDDLATAANTFAGDRRLVQGCHHRVPRVLSGRVAE